MPIMSFNGGSVDTLSLKIQWNLCLIEMRLMFVRTGLIDSKLTLIQGMSWRRPGNKLFLDPMMT